jgi:AraC-like DNA-binding protein
MPGLVTQKHPDIYKRIIRAKEFIDDCCCEAIDIDRIAKEAYFSPYHFIRVFKQIYKKTPHQYLTTRRIDKAKELLSHPEANVTDVCFEIGFESLGSFSTLFNRYVGQSPAKYRLDRARKIYLSVNFPEKLIPSCFIWFNRNG